MFVKWAELVTCIIKTSQSIPMSTFIKCAHGNRIFAPLLFNRGIPNNGRRRYIWLKLLIHPAYTDPDAKMLSCGSRNYYTPD